MDAIVFDGPDTTEGQRGQGQLCDADHDCVWTQDIPWQTDE